MDVFLNIGHAASGLLDPYVILAMVLGTAVGIAVGALPGLSATMGIAVLIPLTFTMEPLVALGMIAGIYNGAMYGGSIPAILLRIPGTPAGIATVFDGHKMARQGKARLALDISLVSSSLGSAVSAVALLLIAPPLALIALKFSPANYFWLAVFGMTTIAVMLAGNPAKGILSACFGLCLGIVGIDAISGNERFTFGTVEFLSGIHIVVLLTGLYAIPPAIDLLLGKNAIRTGKVALGEKSSRFRWSRLIPTWIRASAIGLVVGIIPALGGNIAAMLAWQEERRYAKNKENWGQGEPAGLAAPECANNADTAATLIPALTSRQCRCRCDPRCLARARAAARSGAFPCRCTSDLWLHADDAGYLGAHAPHRQARCQSLCQRVARAPAVARTDHPRPHGGGGVRHP